MTRPTSLLLALLLALTPVAPAQAAPPLPAAHGGEDPGSIPADLAPLDDATMSGGASGAANPPAPPDEPASPGGSLALGSPWFAATVPADNAWHAYDLPAIAGWRLRARLGRRENTVLALRVLDDTGAVVGSAEYTPGFVRGASAPVREHRRREGYLDPIQLVVTKFVPGRELGFRLHLPHLAYCLPPIPLTDLVQGLRYAGDATGLGAGRAPATDGCFVDPYLAVLGAGAVESLAWGDGRFEVRRFYVKPGRDVAEAGFVAVDRTAKTWRRLAVGAAGRDGAAEGVLGEGDVLGLVTPEAPVPVVVRLDRASGARPVAVPAAALAAELRALRGGGQDDEHPTTLEAVGLRETGDGPTLQLGFRVVRLDGAVSFAGFQVRDGRVVAKNARALTPREAGELDAQRLAE